MLKNIDKLESILPADYHLYLVAFRSFDALAKACFSYQLDPDYKQYINDFRLAWTNLRLPIFCKVHLIYDHLAEELERYNMGTALLNESAGESLHADFDRHYQGYQVKDINATSYQKKLLHAIKTYNASHI